jgi:23S rRNA (guanosine2251-2'-O)-methyltransferase
MENRKHYGVRGEGPKRKFHKPAPKVNPEDFVFGIQSVIELLRSEKDIEKVLVHKDSNHEEIETLARQRRVFIQRVPSERLNRITGKNHQGVIAFVSAVNYALLSNVVAEAYEKGKTPLIIILDRITDVRNFGAISRTAEACGADALVIPTRGAAQINSDAMKTSSGALSHIPVCKENDLTLAIDGLQNSGFKVIGCTEKTSDVYSNHDLTGPLAIVMGSEEDGISDSILRKCDVLGMIPMLGQVGSLNVSVAAGVLLYEVIRQRGQSEN